MHGHRSACMPFMLPCNLLPPLLTCVCVCVLSFHCIVYHWVLQAAELAAQLEQFKQMVKDDNVSKEEVDELRKMYKGMDMVCTMTNICKYTYTL
jgi:hypothetical protein